MSPEQLAGEPDEVDTRSDIYALGVIAFELLTGRLPHDVRDRPLSDAVVQLREREPARLGTIDRSLRGDLETVVAKALEQDRDRRYASASDFAGDIERFLRDEPILARPPSVGYQLRKFARRNRVLVGGTLVAAFLLVAGLAGTAWGLFRAREQRDAAIAAKLEVQRESAKVQAVNEFLERMLESANPLGEAGHGGRDVTVLEMLDRESGAVERSFAGQPALEAAVRTTVGVAYANLARLEDAERHLRVAMQLHRTVYGEESAQYARSLREVAGVRARRGEADEAIGMLRRSLEIEQGVDARPHLERALAHGRLGWALLSAGQLDEAESELQGMLSALDELPDDVRTHRAAALNNLARIARMRGDRDQAETLYREADGLFRALYGDRHASVGMTQNNLAKVLLERGAQDAAVEAYREALAVFQTTLGPGHPMVGDVLNNQSQVELDRGNLTESVRLGRAAADVHRLAYGADHIDYALTVNNLGTVLKKSGDYASARACFEEAAAIRRGKLGESHWRTRFSEALAADCTGRLGAPETAEPILLQTFEEFRQTYPPTDERVRAMARLLADHYARRGRPDDAARYAAIAEPAPK
jgi:tetratricopeptide (TPR) repeat protein